MGMRPSYQPALSVNDVDTTIHTADSHAHVVGEEAGGGEDWLRALEAPTKGTRNLDQKEQDTESIYSSREVS